LAVHGVGEQARGAGQGRVVDGHAGLVAARFDAEDLHGGGGGGLRRCESDSYHTRLARSGDQAEANLPVAPAPARRPDDPRTEIPMPSVKVRENEPFEFALRRFKRTCEKAGVLAETRKREYYEKPTQERKRKAAAAVKRQARRVARDVTKRQRLY